MICRWSEHREQTDKVMNMSTTSEEQRRNDNIIYIKGYPNY